MNELQRSRESTQKHNKRVFLANGEPLEGIVVVDEFGNSSSPSSNPKIDAKGRLRTTNFLGSGNDEPTSIFDTKQIFDNNPLFWDDQEVSGGSTTSNHSVDTASSVLGVGTDAGVRTRQTFMWHNYQPAKIQHIIQTGILIKSGGGTGIKVWAGQFNDDNGLAFFYDEGIVKALIRTKTSGVVVDNTKKQSDWDDPMDGNGRSGINIDWTKKQIFGMSYGWLGVDTAFFWLKVNSELYVCHSFHHANIIDVPYMSTPNLPLRWSIENDGSGVASTTNIECSTVISEGGTQHLGVIRYVSTSGTHVDATTENVIYAILGIKLKPTHLGASIELLSLHIQEQAGNKKIEWILFLNPTIADTFDYSDVTNAAIQLATGVTANTVTGGTPIGGGFFNSSNKGGTEKSALDNAIRLGSNIAGDPDEIVVCTRPVGGSSNIDIEAGLEYKDIN